MALPTYKDIIDLVKKGATLEAQEKILELRAAALEIQEENLQLRDQIKQLEAQVKVQKAVRCEKPYYWVLRGDTKEGPYCQLCYDKEGKLIRLQGGKNGEWHCGSCSHIFHDDHYKPPTPPGRRPSNWKVT